MRLTVLIIGILVLNIAGQVTLNTAELPLWRITLGILFLQLSGVLISKT